MLHILSRRLVAAFAGALALLALALAPGLAPKAEAQGTLRVGMTLADIPVSFGQPDQGFEGFRFMGLMLYDALINWGHDLGRQGLPASFPASPRAGRSARTTRPSGSSSSARASSSMTAATSTPTRWSSTSTSC